MATALPLVAPMQFGKAANNAWTKLDPNSPDYDPDFVALVTGGISRDWTRQQAEEFAGVVIPWGDGDPNSNRLELRCELR